MTSLVLGCAFFLGLHVVIAGSPLRGVLVGAIGERRYLALFSLASIGGLWWMMAAYAGAPLLPLWAAPLWLRWPALLVMLPAVTLVVVGLTTPSPTGVGGEHQLVRGDAVRGIVRVTRHPFLWGVALWAATHVTLNGDAASGILFATLLILALLGPLLIDARRRRALGAAWAPFAAATSNVPLAAILAGRNSLRVGEIGVARIAGALALYALLLAGHQWLFGDSPLPVG